MSSEDIQMQEEEDTTLTNPLVIEKYKKAAEIANLAIASVIKAAVPGAKIVDLCAASDKLINENTSKIYNRNKTMLKGVAFPTCISVNNTVGHFSPLVGDNTELKLGDLVKIDLGVQIDGYIAVGAHTIVLSNGEPVTDKRADAVAAAFTGAEAAIRLLKPGNKNSQVTEAFAMIAQDFKVNGVQGVLSHELSRFTLDGEKVIIMKSDAENKVEEVEFQPNQVWTIDVVYSTGEGKPKEADDRTTVYKRDANAVYMLKMQASRAVLSEIDKRFPSFPFTIREFEEKKVRFGIRECYQHKLVQAYPVLQERDGEVVAHMKFTALITANGPVRITGLPLESNIQSANKPVSEELVKILSEAVSTGKKKNKKNKKKAEGDMETEE